jgi:hypothetical protein
MRIYRTVAVLLLASQAGCAASHVLHDPATELASIHTDRIWVMHANGAEVIIDAPQLRNDTIFGLDSSGRDYALPLRHAETITVRQISMRKTVAFSVALAATAVALVMMLRGGSGIPRITSTDCDKRPNQPECGP